MYGSVVWERMENVVVITLNRPRVLNALNRALKGELADVLTKIKSHESTPAPSSSPARASRRSAPGKT